MFRQMSTGVFILSFLDSARASAGPASGPAAGRGGSTDAHRRALGSILDPVSATRLKRLQPVLAGRRILEVGYGDGSFARWLATQTGPTGQVLATDLVPLDVPGHPALRTLSHDIVADEVPDPGTYDVIHVRLLLNYLPARRDVLAKLAAALAPGGVLVTEDWQSTPGTFVAHAPTTADRAALDAFHAAHLRVLDQQGTDRRWATAAHAAMCEEGLTDVRTECSGETWHGGSPGTDLLDATAVKVRRELLDTGLVTAAQLDTLPELLADPDTALHGHRLYTTSGRRPSAG
jgi:predicted methyltransferase